MTLDAPKLSNDALLTQVLSWMFQIENLEHCDFIPLRNMLVRTHLQDLKDVTNNVHYENYRCRKLAGVAGGSVDKIPNRVRSREAAIPPFK